MRRNKEQMMSLKKKTLLLFQRKKKLFISHIYSSTVSDEIPEMSLTQSVIFAKVVKSAFKSFHELNFYTTFLIKSFSNQIM